MNIKAVLVERLTNGWTVWWEVRVEDEDTLYVIYDFNELPVVLAKVLGGNNA